MSLSLNTAELRELENFVKYMSNPSVRLYMVEHIAITMSNDPTGVRASTQFDDAVAQLTAHAVDCRRGLIIPPNELLRAAPSLKLLVDYARFLYKPEVLPNEVIPAFSTMTNLMEDFNEFMQS